MTIKRCATCARFRAYEDDDAFCVVCGHDTLEAACTCGRGYAYAIDELGDELHCPRCGRRLRGRADGVE
jgi:hypothetical protein